MTPLNGTSVDHPTLPSSSTSSIPRPTRVVLRNNTSIDHTARLQRTSSYEEAVVDTDVANGTAESIQLAASSGVVAIATGVPFAINEPATAVDDSQDPKMQAYDR